MTDPMNIAPEQLTEIANLAGSADAVPVWPADSWKELAHTGALRWCIPAAYGGDGLSAVDLLYGYEQLAQACLTTCFILSQRDAACRRIRDSSNDALWRELLPSLARGDTFATVGLSQLTTSRQHTGPTLAARLMAEALVLDGTIPWVTGASRADHLVVGAVLEDGMQVLAVVPTALPGVTVGPPLPLMALEGSITAEVRCNQVVLDRRWLLAGPAQRVMQVGRGGTGGLETSCLALGLTAAALAYLAREAEAREELRPMSAELQRRRQELRDEMVRLAEGSDGAEKAVALRARANTLVLQATQVALSAAKGSGFLRDHPAQRWARQALFFLVWSCPGPAVAATLNALIARV